MNDTIPRHLHLYWVGQPPGRQEVACLRTVRHCHPDWRITVHGEDFADPGWGAVAGLAELRPVELNDPELRRCYAACRSPSLRSDIFRHAILFRWGGVWLDFDVVCLRPLDPLCGYPGFAGSESFGVIGSSVLGARPGSPVAARALELVPAYLDPGDDLSLGPRLATRAVLDCGPDWLLLEPEAFYPWRWGRAARVLRGDETADSFAVHLNHALGPLVAANWDLLAGLAPAFRRYGDGV